MILDHVQHDKQAVDGLFKPPPAFQLVDIPVRLFELAARKLSERSGGATPDDRGHGQGVRSFFDPEASRRLGHGFGDQVLLPGQGLEDIHLSVFGHLDDHDLFSDLDQGSEVVEDPGLVPVQESFDGVDGVEDDEKPAVSEGGLGRRGDFRLGVVRAFFQAPDQFCRLEGDSFSVFENLEIL
jgi:hypothetical protein